MRAAVDKAFAWVLQLHLGWMKVASPSPVASYTNGFNIIVMSLVHFVLVQIESEVLGMWVYG
jgi:hypothetical protein